MEECLLACPQCRATVDSAGEMPVVNYIQNGNDHDQWTFGFLTQEQCFFFTTKHRSGRKFKAAIAFYSCVAGSFPLRSIKESYLCPLAPTTQEEVNINSWHSVNSSPWLTSALAPSDKLNSCPWLTSALALSDKKAWSNGQAWRF